MFMQTRKRPKAANSKTVRISLPVSAAERAEIRVAAKMFNLTMTEYFLRLHRLTMAMMQPASRRRVN